MLIQDYLVCSKSSDEFLHNTEAKEYLTHTEKVKAQTKKKKEEEESKVITEAEIEGMWSQAKENLGTP